MSMLRRLISALAAASVLAFWTVSVNGQTAGAGGPGVHVTPSGYRVPVYGMSFVRNTQGRPGTTCARLTAPQIEITRLGRSVARAFVDSYPRSSVRAASGVTFEIVYTDAPGTGFLDAQEGAVLKRAMEASMAAWSAVLQGTVPIVVHARMEEGDDESALLASAAPIEFFAIDGRLVPSALAAQLTNARQSMDGDVEVVFNPTVDWDYAVNGVAAAGKASFVYVAIHEVAHGLGFLDSFSAETGALENPVPYPYDVFVNRGSSGRNPLTRQSVTQVLEALTSGDLFFAGPKSIEASRRSIRPLPMVKLYAPAEYEHGSSISHVDQDTYSDFKVGLMTPQDFGSGTDKIDILTLAIMEDMGYRLVPGAITAAVPRR